MLLVASSLLAESDRLGERVLVNWEEERRIRKKLAEVREHRFATGAAGGLGLPAGVSKHRSQKSNVGSPMLGAGGGQLGQQQVEETVDPREVDGLLAEMSMMSGRWQLLRRFLYGRLKVRP